MKKKVLAKSFPNKLITELMKREGKKSQVKIGDMREIFKHLANVLTENTTHCGACRRELESYVANTAKKNHKISKAKCDFRIQTSTADIEKMKAADKAKSKVKKSKALGEKNGK